VGTFVGLRGMSFTTHETFYWQGGSSHWSGPNWGISETASGTPVSLPDIRTAHAIFNNSGDTSTVMINGSVAVNTMTVSAGNYTFQGSNGTTATLGVTGDLNISATATLDKLSVSAGRITVENGGALNLAQSTLTADVTSHGTVCLGEGISRIDGTLMLGNDTLVLGHANAQLEATSLESAGSSLTLRIHDNTVLDALNAASRENPVTIISLENAYSGGAALQTASRSGVSNKYFTELRWENGGLNLVYTSEINHQYVNETVRAESANGEAGAELLQQAFETSNPQVTAPGSDLASVLDAVERGLVNDEVAAAVAGASVATLGMALANDMERQLQAIRNRTTTMGVGGDAVVHTGMPYVNAWVNAEGNYSKLQKDGSAAGYTLNNWGGTVGLDVDVDPYLTVGCALSAMYGDYKTQGPDTIKGDLDTCYFTAFARYTSSAWTHTFVASYGMMDASLDRSVSAGGTGYENTGNTEGTSVGLLYELGYVVALDDDASSCLQPVVNVMFRHSGIDAYTEDGGNAALDVDKQSMTTATFAFGTRYQAVVGESMYNRTSILEARVLGKAHVGDRSCQADVAFTNTASGASVESAELGSLGVEAGIGLVIPVGDAGGSLFADASAEYNSGFLNANATLGYRINF
ncbi:MAG: autotransporter outer membrane beta-barrel domain-containing protein, partial [Akkermansia sp.]|nr:autotransporter outer membrane beta-barrel domain-containing protein [Akkermansia sp.]